MTLHKLSAGSGYTYLTRHVAAHDGAAVGAGTLAAYYAERGESPGVWLGRGLAGLVDGPGVGSVVREEQMVALFGRGRHPNQDTVSLGTSFTVPTGDSSFARELTRRIRTLNTNAGRPVGAPVDPAVRAELRSDLAREQFTATHGREPDARELADYLTTATRRGRGSVAGYDLTFSPVKSVSALWALADPDTAAQVEATHLAAVRDVIGWLEGTATFTRLGRDGVRQVDVRGLLAVAFTHRDSRTGDPDLHTHVAISNKVQTLDGRWRALDGRVLHKAAVAASERYNTRLEAHLVDRLGVRFVDRLTERGKRPVREIDGIDPTLLNLWSSRRHAITARQGQLAAEFTRTHGRRPDAGETHDLFAQANLMTRPDKHGPRSLAEQRAAWRDDARQVLDGDTAIDGMLDGLSRPQPSLDRVRVPSRHPAWPVEAARQAVATVSASRATWQVLHVRAELERLARRDGVPLADLDTAVQTAVDAALSPGNAVALGDTGDGIEEPAGLRRRDGSSVFTVAGSQLYTSPAILDAESRILHAATRVDGRQVPDGLVELSLLEGRARGRTLNPSQEQMVRDLATSGCRVQLALAPAGTGKTTTIGALADAWREDGGNVIGLAPSAVAAAELRDVLGGDADTIAKLLHSGTGSSDLLAAIDDTTLVVVDEAGMAGTFDLDDVINAALVRGASVRLVGDTRQLAAISCGGVLRDIARTHPVSTLETAVRFTDPDEGTASLLIREGDPVAFSYYLDHHRIHGGDRTTTIDEAFDGWQADRAQGRDAVLLAASNDTVRDLNERAQAERLGGQRPETEVGLHDGTRASADDVIVTRRNNRRIPITATDWVKNGDRWRVEGVHDDGSLQVQHLASRRTVRLPAGYVAEHVELGYATTIHLAQGRTTDASHAVITGREFRHDLYVAMSRGRDANHVYVDLSAPSPHDATTPDAIDPPTSVEVLERILDRDGESQSATSRNLADRDPASRLRRAIDRYDDAIALAGGTLGTGHRPLPWLPPVPDVTDPAWREYLTRRRELIAQLADVVGDRDLPNEAWVYALRTAEPDLANEVGVWRAAAGCNRDEPQPCGPPDCIAPTYREDLNQRIADTIPAESLPADRWQTIVARIDPQLAADRRWPALAHELDRAAAAGDNINQRLPWLIDSVQHLPAERRASSLLFRFTCENWAAALAPAPGFETDDTDRIDASRRAVEAARRQQEEQAERSRGRGR